MRNNEAKVLSTFFIWFAFTMVSMTAMIRDIHLEGLGAIGLAVLLVAGAVLATQFVWAGNSISAAEADEKAKRRTRLDRVMDYLSDDELEELRARLTTESDGEQVSLEELLGARGRR